MLMALRDYKLCHRKNAAMSFHLLKSILIHMAAHSAPCQDPGEEVASIIVLVWAVWILGTFRVPKPYSIEVTTQCYCFSTQ